MALTSFTQSKVVAEQVDVTSTACCRTRPVM
jgi:hypothetical protein